MLAGLKGLKSLSLWNTQVRDLRPICGGWPRLIRRKWRRHRTIRPRRPMFCRRMHRCDRLQSRQRVGRQGNWTCWKRCAKRFRCCWRISAAIMNLRWCALEHVASNHTCFARVAQAARACARPPHGGRIRAHPGSRLPSVVCHAESNHMRHALKPAPGGKTAGGDQHHPVVVGGKQPAAGLSCG